MNKFQSTAEFKAFIDAKNAYKEAKNNLGTNLEKYLKKWVSEHPEISKVIWTQYTPYFNYGDACVFGVNEPSFVFKKNPDIKYAEYVDPKRGVNLYDIDELPADLNESDYQDLVDTITSLADVLEEQYGDHVEIIVTSQKIEAEPYNHD